MVSTSTASWSSPRPWTSQASGRSVGSTRIDTLPMSSDSSRCSTWRAVTFDPSLPASGEVLIPSVIDRLGSSTVIAGRATGLSTSARVSPIVTSARPAIAQISPGPTSTASTRSSASLTNSSVIFTLLDRAVDLAPRDVLALRDRAFLDPAQREAAEVGGRVEVGDERLERVTRLVGRRGDLVEQELEQRLEVAALDAGVGGRPAGAGVRVDDRELDLGLVRVEVEEQLVDLVDDLLDARVGPVDLVDHEDHRQPRLERLAQDEARSGGAGPRSRRRAGGRRRPSSTRARPRRRSRRGRGCR